LRPAISGYESTARAESWRVSKSGDVSGCSALSQCAERGGDSMLARIAIIGALHSNGDVPAPRRKRAKEIVR
jgi:hypothetical protein